MDKTGLIRLRVCLVVIQDGRILLVPHFDTDVGPVQWTIPGGAVEFGEKLKFAAVREFGEETGLQAACGEILDIYENVQPERPWHSVTIAFLGYVIGGELRAEVHQYSRYGDKTPRWFSQGELIPLEYYPRAIVDKAFAS